MNEKEQVYAELERTQRKCARLKEQVKGLNAALSKSQIVQTRQERDRLKKTLSWIGHSPFAPDDAEELKYAARLVLLGKAYTRPQRERNRAQAADQQSHAMELAAAWREEAALLAKALARHALDDPALDGYEAFRRALAYPEDGRAS